MPDPDASKLQALIARSTHKALVVRHEGRRTERQIVTYSLVPGWVHVTILYENHHWRLITYDEHGDEALRQSGTNPSATVPALLIAEDYGTQTMRKPKDISQAPGTHERHVECRLTQQWPALTEMVTCSRWDDGSPRQTSTITIAYDGGRFTLCLRDRALARVGFHSAATLAELLDMTEAMVSSETMDMRTDKFAKRK